MSRSVAVTPEVPLIATVPVTATGFAMLETATVGLFRIETGSGVVLVTLVALPVTPEVPYAIFMTWK
jgi:hypothetical protein